MNRAKIGACAFALLALASPALAEAEQLCIRYKTTTGWSQSYDMAASMMSGVELIKVTNDHQRFASNKRYAVVFWQQDQATIIEMSTLYSAGGLPLLDENVKDIDGNEWKLRARGAGCF